MREIKFRAWHKKTNQMIYDLERQPSLYQTFNSNNFEPMQYTGLKDKNGREIYEGAIVAYACPLFPKLEPKRFSVTYIDCSFKLKHIFEYICSPLVGQLVEVIGNIYENPELLEVK